jgi:hypothetical protein
MNAGIGLGEDVFLALLCSGVCSLSSTGPLSPGGKNYFASLTTGDMLKTFKVTASYSPMTDLTFAMLATANPEKTTQSLTVGTMYKCNPKTVMRTKVTSAGLISAAVSNQCAPKMTVTVGGEVSGQEQANLTFY